MTHGITQPNGLCSQLVEKCPFWRHQKLLSFIDSIYSWMHLRVCMRMYVFEGVVFGSECDSVYLVSRRILRLSAYSPLFGESAHMCLCEDPVLCGCVFDKLWEHVGDCLSIHLGESGRERAEWGGGGDLLSSLYLQVNLLTVTQTSLSLP